MMSKSKFLITIFSGLFLLLLGIQTYFIYKTYLVREREIYKEVSLKLEDYTIQLAKKRGDDNAQRKLFIGLNSNRISKQQFLDTFEKNRKSTTNQISNYLDHAFKKENYKIALRVRYISIIFAPTGNKLIEEPIIIFQTRNKVSKPRLSNFGTWETSNNSETFVIQRETDLQILNIKSIVFRELALLILCCIALLAGVLVLYIFTTKNLIRQQKLVEVLHTAVDNISHEFKTPIATLKVASKALKKEWNPETLPLIDRQISRLESLMFQLHKDEIPNELLPVRPEDWDFFVQDLTFTYTQTNFKLENKVMHQLPFDKNLMETVLKNLCENSVKYGSSAVQVKILSSQQNLEIIVKDNGQGIERKELKNIFEKFYRIQSNNIHNTKGLGLGLYFVQKITKKYKGTIEVTSQPKEGTTFKINMPYEN
ncbi:HAMP domain-containing sensor histidine kinase [Chryseobacterium sp.]|uniref:sensor histidine kinase n=1 Tax=Chryseobacterium sp. TaxID=1871047 RepID=UPI0026091D7C|nr:HAMP domain-containing sensor histidine kinase [Chryseobacterium sp.]